MNSGADNNNRLSITSKEGWQQMQLLLNEHIPCSQQFSNKKKRLPYAVATLLSTACIFISLQLNTMLLFSVVSSNYAAPIVNYTDLQFAKKHSKINTKAILFFNRLTHYKKQHSNLVFIVDTLLPGSNDIAKMEVTVLFKSLKSADENVNAIRQIVTIGDTIKVPNVVDVLTSNAVKKSSAKNKPYWNFLAGIGVNVNIGTHPNLQPYPTVQGRYNINKEIYFAAAVGIYSPVAVAMRGVSKTVYLNDTVNNVLLYKESTFLNSLHYVDIPLSAGVNINKKIALQAGVQVSVLLGKKSKKIITPYDFQMNSVGAVTAFRQQENPIPVSKIDYRFVTGIRYTINKTVFGVDYQQALQPVSKGSGDGGNKMIALSVIFKMK